MMAQNERTKMRPPMEMSMIMTHHDASPGSKYMSRGLRQDDTKFESTKL